jgi:hypothetical protein
MLTTAEFHLVDEIPQLPLRPPASPRHAQQLACSLKAIAKPVTKPVPAQTASAFPEFQAIGGQSEQLRSLSGTSRLPLRPPSWRDRKINFTIMRIFSITFGSAVRNG